MTERIIVDPSICHGKPIIRGTRVPVTVVLSALAPGDSLEDIEKDYGVTADDFRGCIGLAKGNGSCS